MGEYEVLRSVSNHWFHVIYRAGAFDRLPDSVRREGPWQLIGRGSLERLRADYRYQLAMQGYAVAYYPVAGFSAEAGD